MTPADRTRRIIETVAALHGVTVPGLKGCYRGAGHTAARRAVASAVWIETTLSLPQIGELMNKHHTTILHQIRKTGAWPDRRWPKSLSHVREAIYKEAL